MPNVKKEQYELLKQYLHSNLVDAECLVNSYNYKKRIVVKGLTDRKRITPILNKKIKEITAQVKDVPGGDLILKPLTDAADTIRVDIRLMGRKLEDIEWDLRRAKDSLHTLRRMIYEAGLSVTRSKKE